MIPFLLTGDFDKDQTIISKLISKIIDKVSDIGLRLVLAFAFLVIAWKLIKWVVKLMRKSFKKHELEPGVSSFLISLVAISLKILVFVMAATIVGFQMTSFITILGSAGLALSLSLQGSLSNLAGGLLILLLKPFKVGDYIISDGGEGTVASIDIFYTRLRTPDNQVVIIPNGGLSNSSLTNVTKEDYRRIDLQVEISYDDDISTAKSVLMEVVEKDIGVVMEKEHIVFVDELGASGVVLGVRCWSPIDEYWTTKWRLLENIKYALDNANITIPYTTMDVNVKSLQGK